MHSDHVHIRNPEFVVRKAGRERVLREGKKNVHAFVRGEITHFDDFFNKTLPNYKRVVYNPYKYETFVDTYQKLPVHSADRAMLEVQQGKKPNIYAEGVMQ